MATQEIEVNDGKIYSRVIKLQSARENTSAMAPNRNTKLIFSGALVLMVIVCGSVAVARVITNDDIGHQTEIEGPITSASIVRNIRNIMNDTKIVTVPIQAYIIPTVDAHQSEYIAESDRRMEFVTSFSGSAGTAVIAENVAALWTDSRYFLQAEQQIDNQTWILMKSGQPEVPKLEEWLIDILPPNSRVGIDPFLVEAAEFHRMSEYLGTKGHKMVSVQQNLVDLVWKIRPVLRTKPLEKLEYRFSGKRASEKVLEVRDAITKLDAECLIISALDDIAWLFNLRGSDIEANPVFFAYAILTLNELHLYVLNMGRINYDIENHFYVEGIEVLVREYNATLNGIDSVIRSTQGKVILSKASEAIQSIVPPARRLVTDSPLVMMKVIKNDIEAKGIRNAHYRDGAALVRYLYWLENEVDAQNITEISGAEKLAQFRSQQEHFRGLSFRTISAVGDHAALVHYSPTLETDKRITRDEIYLVDSGGQYLDGTTDVTRTVHLGTPSKKEIDAFTRVLKGFISLSTAIFPSKAPYSFFDAMARRALWDVGLDYGHGTGHGIGAYLNVHEYPPLISSRNMAPGMLKNMFTSNEPGYYEDGLFGIRIESIIQVIQAPNTETYFNGKGALKFADITMAPIQTKLIDVTLLTPTEIEWLNAYHESVRKNLTPLLGSDVNVIEWLGNQTKPIGTNATDANRIASDVIVLGNENVEGTATALHLIEINGSPISDAPKNYIQNFNE